MPEGGIKDALQNKIMTCCSDFGGSIFEPHVTLIGGFLGDDKKLIDKTRRISKKIQPFEILFDGMDYFNEFFRSLFLKVEFNPQLILSRNIACKELGLIEDDSQFHLSLIYGDYTVNQKEKMISSFDLVIDSFSVNSIYLAHNDEINLKWEVIREFPLNN